MSTEPNKEDPSGVIKPVDAWWVVLVIDPFATRTLPWLSKKAWITPNRITVVGGLIRVGAIGFFATGSLIAGAVAYELSFFLDALDGKLARLRGKTSRLGAYLDLSLDVVLNTVAFIVLALWAASRDLVPDWLPVLLAALYPIHVWLLDFRVKVLTDTIPVTTTGEVPASESAGIVRRTRDMLRRRRMSTVPWSIDTETACLFVFPILAGVTGTGEFVSVGLWLAVTYYVTVTSVQWVRTLRATRLVDQ